MKILLAFLFSFTLFLSDSPDYLERGINLQKKGDHLGAIKVFNAAIRETPKNADLYEARARSKYLNGSSFSSIMSDLNKAISLNSNCHKCFELKALVFSNLVDKSVDFINLPAAEKSISRALELESSKAKLWIQRAHIRIELNDQDGAFNDIEKALSIRPNFHRFLHYRALIHLERKDFKMAVKDYSAALKTAPQKNYFKNRGMAFYELGEFAKATADLKKTISLIARQKVNGKTSNREKLKAKQMLSDTYILLGLSLKESQQTESACDAFFNAEYLENHRARLYINRYCKSY